MDFRDKMIRLQVRAVNRFIRWEKRGEIRAKYVEKYRLEKKRVRKLVKRKKVRVFKKLVGGVLNEIG